MRHFSAVSGRSARGVTLVELLIAMAIVGVVLGGVTRGFVSQRKVTVIQNQRGVLVQQAQAAMELVTRELRRAGSNPTGATFTPVTYSTAQLEIRADLDGNGTTTGANEHLIYAYDAANRRITRDEMLGSGAQPLVENIQAFTFRYLDSTGNQTTVNNAIRQLQITITARTAAPDPTYKANNGYRTFTMTSLVALRN
jgi:prepilin-type N-terminal cleavage/methylation domain-containing protein